MFNFHDGFLKFHISWSSFECLKRHHRDDLRTLFDVRLQLDANLYDYRFMVISLPAASAHSSKDQHGELLFINLKPSSTIRPA